MQIKFADICIDTGFVHLNSAGRCFHIIPHFQRFSTLPNIKHSLFGTIYILGKTLQCFRHKEKGHDNISLTLSLSQAVSSRR